MTTAPFLHLRVHTAYSLSEGAIHVKALPGLCHRNAMPAVGTTDTNNLFGALEVSETLCAQGIQPIIGCKVGITNPHLEIHRSGKAPAPDSLLLFVQNDIGYRNLMALVSKAHLDAPQGEPPQIRVSDLEDHSEGLIALTGGVEGPLGRLVLEGMEDKLENLLSTLQALFPGRLYMELSRHGLEYESLCEPAFLRLAYDHDIPLVATNDVFFEDEGMFRAHDALLCIAGGNYVSQDDRRSLTPKHSFRPAGEMAELFQDLPEALANTLVIARRCAYRVEKVDPILPPFASESGKDETEALREMAKAGLERRLAAHVWLEEDDEKTRADKAKPYWERLELELDILIRMEFPGYFLIVADFIRWAKDHDIPVGPGRGSGAGSAVAWALRITDLDPLRFNLLFERFLNPERVSMPDFDIDFCQERRDEVIQYVQEKYGFDQVAQIITFGKLQARAVLRDVGRVLQMPYGQTDRLCKMVPNNPANPVTLAQAIEGEPRLQYERDNDELVAQVIDRSLKLEGLFRHASTHAAGVVIGDRPLAELVPLYRDPRSDMPVTQFNMKWVEKAGLVKFDFLGLKTLTVLSRAQRHLKKRDIEIDLGRLPLDDKATYDLLSSGQSAGIFQLESTGMRSVLRSMKPDTFEDIIALVALYRPGPMDNIPTFVNRKHGLEEVDYLHEWLKPLLMETYGVIIYQEQVMQIAQILADYSLGEADLLRRAMGKKIKSEMDAQRVRFMEGAEAKGVDGAQASFIFDLVAKFAGYGFNKSHAACYALIAYQTGYLKANYPVEFMSALMTLDLHNTDKLSDFKNELQRLEIKLLPPDVNRSGVEFEVEALEDGTLAVRYALAAIKNVGEKSMESVVAERETNGPFRDLFDFSERLDPRAVNKRALEQMAAAGAFDCLNPNRAQTSLSIELLLRHAHAATEQRESNQESLFAMTGEESSRPPLPDVEAWSDFETLEHESSAVGFYLSAHPLDSYQNVLARQRIVPSNEALSGSGHVGRVIKVAGAIDALSERTSQKGNKFGFLRLSDSQGSFEVMVFSKLLDAVRAAVEAGAPLVVNAKVERRDDDGSISLLAEGVQNLDTLAAKSDTGLDIWVANERPLDPVKSLLSQHKGGAGRVSLHVTLDSGAREVIVDVPGGHKITPRVRSAVAALPGVVDAQEL